MGVVRTGLVSAGICVWLSENAVASAWNPEPWGGELITSYVFASADESVNEFGTSFALDIYEKQTIQNYGMLGLTQDFALVAMFDWQDTQISGQGLDIAFSEPSAKSIGLQYQIARKEGRAVAVSVSYLDGIDIPDELLTIENRFDLVELRGLWGESRTWAGKNVFGEVQLASRMELDGGYAGSQAQLTVGVDPTKRSKIIAKGRYVDVSSGTIRGRFIARQERWETEISAVYRVWKQNYIELGYTAIVEGQNTVFENGLKLGFWTKF